MDSSSCPVTGPICRRAGRTISQLIYLASELHGGLADLVIILQICHVESTQTRHMNVSAGVFYAQLSKSLSKTRAAKRDNISTSLREREKKRGACNTSQVYFIPLTS